MCIVYQDTVTLTPSAATMPLRVCNDRLTSSVATLAYTYDICIDRLTYEDPIPPHRERTYWKRWRTHRGTSTSGRQRMHVRRSWRVEMAALELNGETHNDFLRSTCVELV